MLNNTLLKKKGLFRPVGTPVVDITINGKKTPHWTKFSVELNGLGGVDSFSVELPWEVTDKPENPLLFSGPSASSALVFGSADVKIAAGFAGEGNLVELIEGKMDYPEWNFDESMGEMVTIHGRSLAAGPYDFKESVKFQNLTATAAHRQLAKQHGLIPVVPVETTTLIGSYENEDHVNVQREVSHWDYDLYLAQQEGFTTRVKGKEWFFGPREKLPGYLKDPIPFTWGYNIATPFRIERAPNAARNLIVEVISWAPTPAKIPKNPKKHKPSTKPKTPTSGGHRIVEKASFKTSSGNKYTLRYYYPGLTRDQAQRKARNLLKELSRQQVYGSFHTDWFPELSNDRRIAMYGVGQGLSQIYFAPKIVISGDKDNGLSCEISFTNLPLEEGGQFG
ncbi:hypothetical protein [Aneurinibacillus terranovensis]|uniref:hypothetical protein n=1 Tax=Aneurinibacillus terranovensis TaxID=278991 RepID=UPI00042A36A8|nr:hypothetical protein [Aneurinibacillus terranovensis]